MTYAFRAMYTCTFLLLAGCAQNETPPVYLTAEVPVLPEQCFPDQIPAPKEPKLNPAQDATDVDAVRDREAWKRAFRTERSHRIVCAQRLDVLFPKERGKPTS